MSDKQNQTYKSSVIGYYCSEAVEMIEKLRIQGFQGTSKEIREEAIKRVLRPIPYETKTKD